MTWRTGHGRGKGSPRIEVLPADELPSATPAIADRAQRGPDGRFLPSNTVARSQRLRPGVHGGVDTSDPRYRPFKAWARRYAAHRRDELAAAHGGSISAGVGAIVESASKCLGASRFIEMLAGETGSPDLFKRAADLGGLARQHELAAWELAARECIARGGKKKTTASLRADLVKGST